MQNERKIHHEDNTYEHRTVSEYYTTLTLDYAKLKDPAAVSLYV